VVVANWDSMMVQTMVQPQVEVETFVEYLHFVFAVAVVVAAVVLEHQLFGMDLMVLEYQSIDLLVDHNKDDHVE